VHPKCIPEDRALLPFLALAAAMENPVESLHKEATCSICLEYFRDPVSIPCGHSFCRSCIAQCWKERSSDFSCPQCRVVSLQRNFRPNRELGNVVEIAKRLGSRAEQEEPGGGGGGRQLCPKHREALKLFCINITLDTDTANPQIIISEDRKSARWDVTRTDVPHNPKRFKSSCCVLGCEGFTSGRHYWEVNVEDGGIWAVGVARASVRRKIELKLTPEEGIWALQGDFGQYQALTTPVTPLSPLCTPRRIRVFLDYEREQVEFLNADTKDSVFIFLSASFSGERVFPFFKPRSAPHFLLQSMPLLCPPGTDFEWFVSLCKMRINTGLSSIIVVR
uniref:Uncharacterized protein n=1 Tax=Podarcis muralis TaxID=64176 RepID=A0A670K645_PODMU